ncbi:hypothetical protein F5Y18DRAFT_23174 [Xylariaceae sp. FL1019]|nr:hypothetical protein F5Y18DRAFT_23174 [Xylariaceae sp. FL1019]
MTYWMLHWWVTLVTTLSLSDVQPRRGVVVIVPPASQLLHLRWPLACEPDIRVDSRFTSVGLDDLLTHTTAFTMFSTVKRQLLGEGAATRITLKLLCARYQTFIACPHLQEYRLGTRVLPWERGIAIHTCCNPRRSKTDWCFRSKDDNGQGIAGLMAKKCLPTAIAIMYACGRQ